MRTFHVLALLATVACGKSSAPPPPSTPGSSPSTSAEAPTAAKESEVANGTTLTDFQKKRLLGHYSTENGASGFTLDRTQKPWRARLDGTGKITTMEVSNTPKRGETEYKSSDGAIWIRVDDESGEVLLFQGPKQHEGVRIVRDANADQLK